MLIVWLATLAGAAWATEGGVDAYTIAKDFGFPAVVALVVLVRLDSTMSKLARAVELLTRALIRHGVDVDDDGVGGKA